MYFLLFTVLGYNVIFVQLINRKTLIYVLVKQLILAYASYTFPRDKLRLVSPRNNINFELQSQCTSRNLMNTVRNN